MEYRLKIGDDTIPVTCTPKDDGTFLAIVNGREMAVFASRISPYQLHVSVDGKAMTVFTHTNSEAKALQIKGRTYLVEDADLLAQRAVRPKAGNGGPQDIVPPMPAVVIKILVSEGDQVEKSQPLIVLSAMKMETTLNAPYAGTVTKVHVAQGDKVAAKQKLMDIEKDEG